MFDTMTLTKIVGSLCGALLVYMMGNWAAETLYTTGGGHGDDHHQAYVIDTGDGGHDDAAEEEGPSLAEMMAAADADKGKKVFNKCKACHKLEDGANSTGPFLYGVVGRDIASADGFAAYSDVLNGLEGDWTPETLDAFLENPKGYAPGTGMAFSGLPKATDRANLIMFLDQLDGDVYEMAVPAEESHDDAAVEDAVEEATTEVAEAAEGAVEDVAEAAEAAVEEVVEEATETAGAAAEEVTETAEAAVEATQEVAEEAQVAVAEVAEAVTQEAAAAEEAVEEAAGAAASGGSEFAALVAAADPAAGEAKFKQCKSCHKAEDGARGVGPHLYDVVGRDVAAVEGYKYSDALKAVGGSWTADRLNEWLTNPKAFADGTKMRFKGLSDIQDRANVVAYLASVPN